MTRRPDGWPDVMTVEQVAAYLQLNKLTVYKFVRDGRIPASRVGRALRVLREDVDRFLLAHRVPSTVGARGRPKAAEGQTVPGSDATRRGSAPANKYSDEIYVGPNREERAQTREAFVTSNPVDWVIRGLH